MGKFTEICGSEALKMHLLCGKNAQFPNLLLTFFTLLSTPRNIGIEFSLVTENAKCGKVMKSYLLLRDNQQSGPYTIEEIRKKGLHPSDLIWIEGHSLSWSFPAEIDDLKVYITATKKKRVVRPQQNAEQVEQPVSTRTAPALASSTASMDYSAYLNDNVYDAETKELFSDFKLQSSIKRRRFDVANNLVALLVLVIGVAMTAYVVRSIVLSFGGENEQIAQATEIQSISYESEHAAYTPSQPLIQSATAVMPATTSTEAIIPEESIVDEQKKSEPLKVVSDEPKQQPAQAEEKKVQKEVVAEVPIVKDEAEEKKPKEEVVRKEPVKKDVKSQMSLSSNDYKVGVLGGISNLELQVTNNSSNTVDKATVEVSYYKPNGSVVGRETVQVQNIKPGGSKKVQVPSSSRGVKADYRVVNAEASDSDSR